MRGAVLAVMLAACTLFAPVTPAPDAVTDAGTPSSPTGSSDAGTAGSGTTGGGTPDSGTTDGSAEQATGRAPLMLVFDASGSMKLDDKDGGARVDAAKSAVRQLIGGLPDDARLGIETYGTNTGAQSSEKDLGCQDVTVLQPVAPLDPDAAEQTLEQIEPSGYSPIGEALRTAADALPDNGRRTILLVSDGYDYCTTPAPCDAAKQLAATDPGLTIHVLGIDADADADDADTLRCIATATGGSYADPDQLDLLAPLLAAGYQRRATTLQPTGTAVEGTAESSDRTPVLTPGRYLDGSFTRGTYSSGSDTKRGTVRYYRVPFADGMTPWASASVIGDVRSEQYHSLGLRLAFVNRSDDPCLPPVEQTGSGGDSDPMPLRTTQIGGVTPNSKGWADACTAGQPVYLRVERLGEYRFDTALPVEIVFRAEPAASDPAASVPASVADDLDPPADGPAEPVAGGSDFGTAARLTPGSTVSDTLVGGETRFYAVPLGWGQRLSYRLTPIGVGTPVEASGETARVTLRNPLQAPVATGSDGSFSPFRFRAGDDGAPESFTGSSAAPVRYGNRRSEDEKVRGYAIAGTYYLQLSLSPSEQATDLTVPFTLTVDVSGGADEQAVSAPQYLPGQDSGEPPATVAPTLTPDDGSAAAGPSASTPGWVWGLGGAAAALLIAALFTLLRRRRTRA